MANRARPHLSLRSLSLASAAFLGVLMIVLALGATWTSRLVWETTVVTERKTRAIVLSGEIERTLLEYQRLANLVVASGDPGVEMVRSAVEADLRRMLATMEEHVDGPGEMRLLARLAQDFDEYLAERLALEAERRPLEAVVRLIRPSLERTLDSGLALRGRTELSLRETQAQAARLIRQQTLLSVASTVLLLAGLALVVFGVHRLVLHPLLALREAMRRFRGGQAPTQPVAARVAELRELNETFDEMAARLANQKHEQLTFLAGIAHDLRNPLSALKTSIRTMELDPSTSTPERLQLLGRQIDLLTRMVSDFLDASRIEAGELELRLEPLDLRDVARAMAELYTGTSAAHPIALTLPREAVPIRADPLRMEQVTSNLITNAIKYSPSGGLVGVAVAASGDLAELAISDHGVGIAPDEIEDMFLPFRRSRRSRQIAAGVGLGLSIIQRIVRAHGGSIAVESVPGEGSTFRVQLPLATVERPGPPNEGMPAATMSVATKPQPPLMRPETDRSTDPATPQRGKEGRHPWPP